MDANDDKDNGIPSFADKHLEEDHLAVGRNIREK